MDIGERLVQAAKRYQDATGEASMVVVVEKQGQDLAVHTIQYDHHFGLLVDGRYPSLQWYQQAEDFHPLQDLPVLH